MRVIQQIKDQWLGIAIGAAIAIGAGGFFYWRSLESREPTFAVDPARLQIVSAVNVAAAPIKVLRQDNTPIRSDVYAVRVFFWNEGKRSIRPENLLDTLRLDLGDSTSEILDFKLLRVSRPIARVSLERGPGPRTLLIRFGILEQGDGFAAQIIYQGGGTVPIAVTGTIEGAQIRAATPLTPSRELVRALPWAIPLIIFTGLVIPLVSERIARVSVRWLGHWPFQLVQWIMIIVTMGVAVAAGILGTHQPPRLSSDIPAVLARQGP